MFATSKALICLTAMVLLCMLPTTAGLEYGEACTRPTTPAPAAEVPSGNESSATNETATANSITKADETCSATAWLICDGTKCVCQPGMVVGKDRKTCISIVGQPCHIAESDPSKPARECIENSFCDTPDNTTKDSICHCDNGYLPIPGNVACRLGPGSECVRTEDCNTNALLSCQNGKCMCDRQESQVWDPIQSKCLSVVGGSCNEGEDAFVKRPCVENAVCNSRTMRCECMNTTYKETPDKLCMLSYDQRCEVEATTGISSGQCHPYYECIATTIKTKTKKETVMKCGCNTTTTAFDPTFGICAILTGKSCTPSSVSGAAFCVERAICSERYKECKCEADFIQTSNGRCVGGYRADCNLPSDLCDVEKNLICSDTDHKCECKQNYTYNSNARKCVGHVGTNCIVDSDCFELAECADSPTDKRCRCRDGYSPTPSNYCLVSYGKYCSGPGRCNPFDFLLCDVVDKACACENPTTMTINNGTGKCVSLAGSHCYTAEIEGMKLDCVDNAKCTRVESLPDSIGNCNCMEGYKDVDGYCVKGTSGSGGRLYATASVQQLFAVGSVLLAYCRYSYGKLVI